ncbi:MAG: glycosyltransferase family 4 protein [Candidatus Thorarchaeota archaeon]|nr:glycosyltransferase family 4 protein [Candidatus Thorarchaeota archaeon]
MKVLFLSSSFYPSTGGSAVFFSRIAHILIESGHSVDVLVLKNQNGFQSFEEQKGMRIFRAPPIPSLLLPIFGPLMILYYWLRIGYKERYSRIIANNPDNISISLNILAKLFRLPPIVYAILGNFERERLEFLNSLPEIIRNSLHSLCKRTASIALGITSRVITSSEVLPTIMSHGVPESYVSTDPYLGTIDLERFKYTSIEEPKENIVLFIGRLTYEMGTDVILSAIPQVLASVPDARFIFAGPGTPKNEWIEGLDNLIAEGTILFKGSVPNEKLPDEISASKIVLVVKRFGGGIGLTPLEALAMKRTLVQTRINPVIQAVADEHDCMLIVPVNDEESLADGIVNLLNDDDLRSRLASNGYRFVQEYYNPVQYKKRFLRSLGFMERKK